MVIVALRSMVPAARASGIGSDVQRPLATVVVGGLLSTLFLTLLACTRGFGQTGYRARVKMDTKLQITIFLEGNRHAGPPALHDPIVRWLLHRDVLAPLCREAPWATASTGTCCRQPPRT